MKFLSSSFREAMADFFGKAGMPWHGVMLVRKPHGSEQVSEGEYVVSYIDGMMSDKKEDGFATLSAVYLALKKYKEDCPWINRCGGVKTDGAGAYAGLVFTVGLSFLGRSTGIRVDGAYTGESGKNKTQLDGHFAVKGPKIRRLVAAALHDILTPDSLFDANAKTAGCNEAVQLFQPDRSAGSTLDVDTKSVKQLSAMSHRSYEYDEDDNLVALVLRQQTNLGEGLNIDAAKLRKPDAAPPLMPRLLREHGSTSQADGASAEPALSASAAREQAAAQKATQKATPGKDGSPMGSAAAGNSSGTSGARLPIARTKAGREHQERLRARGRAKRETAAEQQRAAKHAAELTRCRQSNAYWCRLDSRGHTLCCRVFQTARGLNAHIEKGRHTEGSVKPFQSKGAVEAGRGTAHDRDIDMVQRALLATTRQSVSDVSGSIELQSADGFGLIFANGRRYGGGEPPSGWARAQRQPSVRVTVEQLEFVYEAFTVGKTFDKVKLSPAEAHEIMKGVGKPGGTVAKRFPGHPYFDVNLGRPRFARPEVLDEPKIKAYFGKSADALKKQLQRARERGEVVEEEDEEEGGEHESDGAPRKRRRQKRRGKQQETADSLLDARAKLANHEYDVAQATDGNTRQHLNVKQLKALLGDAGQAANGNRGELITRARAHAAALVARARDAASAVPGAGAPSSAASEDATQGEGADSNSGVDAAADSADAAAANSSQAAVKDPQSPLNLLRTSELPKGLSITAAKAGTVAAVCATCGALAEASDSELREAMSDGRLQGIGFGWLRRLRAALSHLRTDASGGASVVAATVNQQDVVMDLRADLAAAGASTEMDEGGGRSDGSISDDASSDGTSSSSELGSAIGTDEDDESDSSVE